MTLKATVITRVKPSKDELGDSSSSSECLPFSAASTNTDVSLKLHCRPIDTRLSFYKSLNAVNETSSNRNDFSDSKTTERRLSTSSSPSKLYRYKAESQIVSPLDRELVVKSADRLARPVRLVNTASYRSHSKLHSIKTDELMREKPKTAAVTHSLDRSREHGGARGLRSKATNAQDYVVAWIRYHQQHGFLRAPKNEAQPQPLSAETSTSELHHSENSQPIPPGENDLAAERSYEVRSQHKMPKTVMLREYPDQTGQLPGDYISNHNPLTYNRNTYDTTKSKLLGSMRSGFSNHLRGPVATPPSYQRPSHYQPLIDLTISQNQPITDKQEKGHPTLWVNKTGHNVILDNKIPLDSKSNWAESRYDWVYSSEPVLPQSRLRQSEQTTHHDWLSRSRQVPNQERDWRNNISLRMANEESSFTQVVKLNRNTQQRLARTTHLLGGGGGGGGDCYLHSNSAGYF